MNMHSLKVGDFVDFIDKTVLAAPMPKVWYLLRLHPNYDLKAERQLHERGISAYVPKEKRIVRGVWKRKLSRDIAIFPGAMFIPDFDADLARLKNSASGIGGFVKRDGEALEVSLAWMDKIRKFEAARNGENGRRFKIGQTVQITRGPFNLWEGRIERLDSNYRLRVLIDLLQGEVPVDIDEDQVEAV